MIGDVEDGEPEDDPTDRAVAAQGSGGAPSPAKAQTGLPAKPVLDAPGFDVNNVGSAAPVLSNPKITVMGNEIVLTFWFANKGKTAFVGNIVAVFKVGKKKEEAGRSYRFGRAKGFVPLWGNITDSTGLSGPNEIQVEANKAVQFVVVGDAFGAGGCQSRAGRDVDE